MLTQDSTWLKPLRNTYLLALTPRLHIRRSEYNHCPVQQNSSSIIGAVAGVSRLPNTCSIMPTFLQIPRELRDLIYEYYFHVDSGYIHDFVSNTLRKANGDPIQLTLAHVCRQLSIETRGVALRVNSIHFTTFHSDETRKQAALTQVNHHLLHDRKVSLVNESAPALLSPENVQTLAKAYPQFTPIIDGWRSHGQFGIFGKPYVDCGEAPSLWQDFIAFTLNVLSQHPDFAEKVKTRSRFWPPYQGNQAFDLSNTCPKPWNILDIAEIERLGGTVTGVSYRAPFVAESTKYAFSTAQVAIRFLRSIPTATCGMVRNIALLEDRESVARPVSHARGLITFCQAHLQLKIERSVSICRALLPVSRDMVGVYHRGY